ncbi:MULTISPECIES: hypothetical protein [Halorussus]|uniref:hypothetical protein n=1 Tax=Halorussus TaxID=1070314 RepID=UPI000E211634|nr:MULTISPECIES: hypothetical protein [Halorussus]NHN60064.1 hypothetical protein [Halorussus sp. JP-T4]
MPLSESQWEQAEPDDSVIALIYGFLADEKPTAYSIEEIFDAAEANAQRGSASTWEDVGAFLGGESAEDKYRWAFEYLVHAGELEKRVVFDGGEKVEYYRAA